MLSTKLNFAATLLAALISPTVSTSEYSYVITGDCKLRNNDEGTKIVWFYDFDSSVTALSYKPGRSASTMIHGDLISDLNSVFDDDSADDPNFALTYVSAAGMGFFTGPLIGRVYKATQSNSNGAVRFVIAQSPSQENGSISLEEVTGDPGSTIFLSACTLVIV